MPAGLSEGAFSGASRSGKVHEGLHFGEAGLVVRAMNVRGICRQKEDTPPQERGGCVVAACLIGRCLAAARSTGADASGALEAPQDHGAGVAKAAVEVNVWPCVGANVVSVRPVPVGANVRRTV